MSRPYNQFDISAARLRTVAAGPIMRYEPVCRGTDDCYTFL